MSDIVWVALLMGTFSLVGLVLQNRWRRNERAEDAAEREAVAAKVAAAATQAAEAAKLLLESNKVTAESTKVVVGKLDKITDISKTIHTLVNSDMTETLEALLVALENNVVLMKRDEVTDPQGIKATEHKIADLKANLVERREQQELIDAQKPGG